MKIKGKVRRLSQPTSLESLMQSVQRMDTGRREIVLIDGRLAAGNVDCNEAWRTIKERGVQCIAVDGLSRRVYRDGINNGIAVIELPTVPPVASGTEIEVDLLQGRVNWSEDGSGKTVAFAAYNDHLIGIINAGGLVEFTKLSFR